MSLPTSPTAGQTAVINGIAYTYSTATNSWSRVASTVTATTQLSVTGNIASTSTTTGGLTVAGGVGIGGSLYVGSTTIVAGSILPASTGVYDLGSTSTRFRTLYVTSSTIDIGGYPISVSNGSLQIGTFNASSTATSTSTTTGALVVGGGVGIGGALYMGGPLVVNGIPVNAGNTFTNIAVTGTTASTNTATGALTVTGGAGIGGAVNIGGTLSVTGQATFNGPVTFNGTASYILSTNTYYTDNILEVHVPPGGVYGQWSSDDGKDVGLRFHYYNRSLSTDSNAALVLADDSQNLEWYGTGAESSTGTFIGASYGTFKTGNITLVGTGTSTLSVTGGASIGGSLTAASTSYVAGAQIITTATIGQYASSGGSSTGTTSTFAISNTTSSTSTATGALTIAGGVGIGGAVYISTSSYIAGAQIITTATIGNYASTATYANTATSLTIGTSTNTATYYLVFVNTTTGNLNVLSDAGSKLTYNPGTGQLNATSIVAGGVRSTTTSTAPVNPVVGDMWYNTLNNVLYRYTFDGVSNYWIDESSSVVPYTQQLDILHPFLFGL